MIAVNLLRRKKFEIKPIFAVLYTLLVTLFSFLGAKLLYTLENLSTVMLYGIKFDGVSLFGAIFTLPLLLFPICKLIKLPYGKFMDYISPSLMLILATLRIGCYISGCCGGVNGFPVQIVEAVFDLCIMAFLLIIEKSSPEGAKGKLYPYIMALYGVLRFILEFVRDNEKNILYMSNGQIFSLLSVAIGVVLLVLINKRANKMPKRTEKRKYK